MAIPGTARATVAQAVCLCIVALGLTIRFCRWEREEISRDLRQG